MSRGLTRVTRGRGEYAYQPIASRRMNLERLEPRQLLAANPIITEFMARNDGGLRDGDGRASDWIEVFNAGDESVDLNGYRLTDDHSQLGKFVFPSVTLDAGQYLVVFASGQSAADYVDLDGNYHTNFGLQRGGDYVALVAPNNTIVSEYGTGGVDFPEQVVNVSYGLAQSLTLITPDSSAAWRDPAVNLGTSWTEPGYDAAANGFTPGTASVGFETNPSGRNSFADAIQTELPSTSFAVLNRIPFDLNSAAAISNLTLRLQYDDGFVAFLNGVRVAEDNAPANLSEFATALSARSSSAALQPAEFDLTQHTDLLVDGTNVLGIYGMNHLSRTEDDSMLFAAELVAGVSDMQAATGQPAAVGYMLTSSPGAPNASSGELFSTFAGDTAFSVDRGFYYEPFQVEITSQSEGAEVRYTTDGSAPTFDTGTVYAGPITISTTTTLRAAAFLPNAIPSNVDTQTYLFPNAILHQDDSYVTQDFANWGSRGPDWEMDPDVLNHEDPESRPVSDDLLSIPSVSLVVNWDQFFGDGGIYIRGEGVEEATSFEIIYPDGADGVQVDGSVQVVGGSSPNRWKTDKLSLRVKFNREYGSGDLEFPVFGDEAAQTFDTLVLDNYLNNVWDYAGGSGPTGQRERAQYLRDAMASDIQNALGGYASHDTFMFLYVNGILWGMTRVHERPDDNFTASYLGGENEDYDIIKHTQNTAVTGTTDNYKALLSAAREDMTDPANYEAVTSMLDVHDLADYMLGNFYGGNADWDHHNWYASFNKNDPDGRWRFHSWDAEKYFEGLRDNVTNKNNNGSPSELHQRLLDNPEYKLLFADHVQRQMFNGGVLTPETMTALYQLRLNEINDAIKIESARWGDNQRPDEPYTRGDEWLTERDRLLNDYFPQRTDVVLGQLENRNVLPEVAAPVLNQHGGVVPEVMDITLSAALGTIYYTTDGSDPRLIGGQVAPGAIAYTDALNVTENTTIKARALHDGNWSAIIEAPFQIASDVPLRITEINYNPHDANPVAGMNEEDVANDRFEFIELVNASDQPINLDGVQLARSEVRGVEQGITFTFASQTLAPNERFVVVRDRAAFQSRYGTSVRIAAGKEGENGNDGEYGGRLSNQGERLTLVDSADKTIQQFDYRVGDSRLSRANARGSSLEIVDPSGGYTDATNWRASSDFGGSPGTAGQGTEFQVVINEVLANPGGQQNQMVELRNTTGQDINITNWYLSNSADNYFLSTIASPTTIAAGGYHVIGGLGLELDGARGDQIWLVAADANGKPLSFVDHVQFGTSLDGVSLGSTPQSDEFVQMASPTLGSANTGARINEVIISEVYYAPEDPDGAGSLRASDFEFIELYNRSASPVDIAGWQISGDIQFTFASGTVLGAGETATLVRFDPGDLTKAPTFRFVMGLPPAAQMVGERIRASLGDESGVVQLFRPGAPPADLSNDTPMVFADGVAYGSTAPWPSSPAGAGDSLTRTEPNPYGDLPTSWTGRAPSPGTVDFVVRHAGDANEDGQFDQMDITLVLQANKYNTGQPATWSEGDWTGDGQFNQLDIVAALQSGGYLQGPLGARSAAVDTAAADDDSDAVDTALRQLGDDDSLGASLLG